MIVVRNSGFLLVAVLWGGCVGSRSELSAPDAPTKPVSTPSERQPDAPAPSGGGSEPSKPPPAAWEPGADLPPPTTPPEAFPKGPFSVPDEDLKVAFIGDQGLGDNGRRVLELIRDEGADFVIHSGDFDYLGDPAAWEAQLDAVLGEGFPYFVNVGNHDLSRWDGDGGYKQRMSRRLTGIKGANCAGDYGVNAICHYRGLAFVLSGVGTLGSDHERFIRDVLDADRSLFRICTWHKNQHDMQVGTKTDEVGWEAYKACQEAGALIVTGHEHSYARTRTVWRLGERDVGYGAFGPYDEVTLQPGRTAVIVSGLGGYSQRYFTPDHSDDTWWASVYASGRHVKNGQVVSDSVTAAPGALFIDFHVDGESGSARGYFKNIDGDVIDEFKLLSHLAGRASK